MTRPMIRQLLSIYRKLPVKVQIAIVKLCTQSKLLKLLSLGKSSVVTATIDGITYELDLSELIDFSIYYEGCFEPRTKAVIVRYVKPGMTVFDVGANVGAHTLTLARLVGESGKVIAFEPMPWALLKLKRNIELNDFNNIIVEKKALADVKERKSAYFESSYPLIGNLPSTSGEVVDFITIDEYIKLNKINELDFMKIDTDGYEYKVIRGGEGSLKKFKPIIVIEFYRNTLRKYGTSLDDLIELLAKIGYSFYSEKDLKQYDSKYSLLHAIPNGRSINVVCSMERLS